MKVSQAPTLNPSTIGVTWAVSGAVCRRTDRWRAKFELLHTVRTHMGASDANYGCVVQREDKTGKVRQDRRGFLGSLGICSGAGPGFASAASAVLMCRIRFAS